MSARGGDRVPVDGYTSSLESHARWVSVLITEPVEEREQGVRSGSVRGQSSVCPSSVSSLLDSSRPRSDLATDSFVTDLMGLRLESCPMFPDSVRCLLRSRFDSGSDGRLESLLIPLGHTVVETLLRGSVE